MCGAVRASPLLRPLLICQVACRLEWCIAAKTQSSGTAHLRGGVPGGGESPWMICRLVGVFSSGKAAQHTPEDQTGDRFVLSLQNCFILGGICIWFFPPQWTKRSSTAGIFIRSSLRPEELLFLIWYQKLTKLCSILSALQRHKS